MTAYRVDLPTAHVLNSASQVLSGAKLYVYQFETTTPVALFTDPTLMHSLDNPVVADSTGRLAPAYVNASSDLTITLKTSGGDLIWTFPVSPLVPATGFLSQDGSTWVISNADDARAALGVEIGVDVEPVLGYTPLAVGLHTIPILAGAMTPRQTNGPSLSVSESASNKVNLVTLDFDKDTAEYAQIVIPTPKMWNAGTVSADLSWKSSGTGDCKWSVQALALGDGDTIDTAFGTAVTVTDTNQANKINTSSITGAVTAANTPQKRDLLLIQISRVAADVADTLDADAQLIQARIFITYDAPQDT